MIHSMYELQYAKRHQFKKVKPVPLAIVELHLSEDISQSVENSVK